MSILQKLLGSEKKIKSTTAKSQNHYITDNNEFDMSSSPTVHLSRTSASESKIFPESSLENTSSLSKKRGSRLLAQLKDSNGWIVKNPLSSSDPDSDELDMLENNNNEEDEPKVSKEDNKSEPSYTHKSNEKNSVIEIKDYEDNDDDIPRSAESNNKMKIPRMLASLKDSETFRNNVIPSNRIIFSSPEPRVVKPKTKDKKKKSEKSIEKLKTNSRDKPEVKKSVPRMVSQLSNSEGWVGQNS